MMRRKISFLISESERNMIEGTLFLEPFLEDNLQRIKRRRDGFKIEFDEEDLNDLLSALKTVAQSFLSYREKKKWGIFVGRIRDYIRLIESIPAMKLN